jgi:hypothetical protein
VSEVLCLLRCRKEVLAGLPRQRTRGPAAHQISKYVRLNRTEDPAAATPCRVCGSTSGGGGRRRFPTHDSGRGRFLRRIAEQGRSGPLRGTAMNVYARYGGSVVDKGRRRWRPPCRRS